MPNAASRLAKTWRSGDDGGIGPESGERLHERAEALQTRVQHPVGAFGIVPPVPEGPVRLRVCPVREQLRVGPAGEPVDRTGGDDRFDRHEQVGPVTRLAADEEGAGRGEDVRADRVDVAFPQ